MSHIERGLRTASLDSGYDALPDIMQVISARTLLKRSDVKQLLKSSGRCTDFLNNPQAFTEKALEIIARNRHDLAIDGISYIKLDGQEYWIQEIFNFNDKVNGYGDVAMPALTASADRAIAVESSVYDHVVCESGIEKSFAQSLDKDPDVKLFFKIPERFTIETPIGTYNPDWAVYLEKDDEKKLYFVLETKGTTSLHDLRAPEWQKMKCGKAHFEALENDIVFSGEPVRDWREFRKQA